MKLILGLIAVWPIGLPNPEAEKKITSVCQTSSKPRIIPKTQILRITYQFARVDFQIPISQNFPMKYILLLFAGRRSWITCLNKGFYSLNSLTQARQGPKRPPGHFTYANLLHDLETNCGGWEVSNPFGDLEKVECLSLCYCFWCVDKREKSR